MSAQKAINTSNERVRVLQRRLYRSAKEQPDRKYGNLYDKTHRMDVLQEAWKKVSRRNGAPGVDGKSLQWIREYGVNRFLEDLQELLRSGCYKPSLIRRTYIPKGDGTERPLGIPTVADRVVQAAVKLVIEPLFEADFLNGSYGYRPNRSSHQAIKSIDDHLRRGYRWVVDVDLKSYFDTIPHERLLTMVQVRVTDRKIVRLIRYWLKAGILEDGKVTYPEHGSPQGGVLSPLLANLYLHEIDKEWSAREPRAVMIRYADDMLILCPTEADARGEYDKLKTSIESLGLTLNESKTRVAAALDGFDFLGFSFRKGTYVRGGRTREIIIKVPRAKTEKAMRAKIKERVKSVKLGDSLDETIRSLNRRLRGWVNYYCISNLRAALKGLVWYTCKQLRIHLRRRFSRKNSQYSRRWPDNMFHDHYGLLRVTDLLTGSSYKC